MFLLPSNHRMKYESHLFVISFASSILFQPPWWNEATPGKTFTICHRQPRAHKALLFSPPETKSITRRFNFGVGWEKQQYYSVEIWIRVWWMAKCFACSTFFYSHSAVALLLVFDTFTVFPAIEINHSCVFPFLCFWWTSSFFSNAPESLFTVIRFKALGIIYI